jgi:hypothetical protein
MRGGDTGSRSCRVGFEGGFEILEVEEEEEK